MKKRFKTISAVMLMLIRENNNKEEILLQKRQNTGYCDGYYDFSCSGHVEENETMTDAVCREAKEELNIEISPDDLEFICLIHKKSNNEIYNNIYFKITKWNGHPIINEPNKNEELKWFYINDLPNNLINDRIQAINNYQNKIKYSEYGWEK